MSSNGTDHPGDDLAVYALDALDAAERQAIDDHLARCADCRTELATHLAVLVQLVPDETPPPGLWQRIARRTRTTTRSSGPATQATNTNHRRQATRPRTVPAPTSRPPARTSRWPRPLLAAVSVAAGILAVAGLSIRIVRDNGSADMAELASDVLADSRATTATLHTPAGIPVARVVTSTAGSFVLIDDLPPLPAGRAYQLWRVDSTQPVSLAVLGDGTTNTVPISVPTGTSHLALSEEPVAGAHTPTGIIASGALPAHGP